MLSKIIEFVKENKKELVLLMGVIMISSLSFAFGYIVAKTENRAGLELEYIDGESSTHWNNS